jgi:aryl-alcohol dehydrogenase-like predicted oxidoreductase
MHRRVLGHSGLEVSAVGLGCMGFSHGYGPGPGPNEAISLIREAVDLGCTFFDTAEGYGTGANEELLGRALAPIRDQVVIATKFRVGAPATRDELAQQVRAYLQASLARLRTDRIELYYWHWGAAPIPVEDVAAVMGDLIGVWGARSPHAL